VFLILWLKKYKKLKEKYKTLSKKYKNTRKNIKSLILSVWRDQNP